MRSILLPYEELDGAKHVLWPLLEMGEARDDGRSTAQEAWDMLKDRKSQAWLVVNGDVCGVMLSGIVNYPRLRACDIQLCAGQKVKDWIYLLGQDVEPWAREQGCEKMEGRMRKGWARLLPDYQTSRLIMEKPL